MTDAGVLAIRYTLAVCVWREARNQSDRGMRLVAQTVENRVTDRRWPDDYVSVITQPFQFSSWNLNDPNARLWPHPDDRAWPRCVAAADAVLNTEAPFTTANHYHVRGLDPSWRDVTKIVAVEGAHVFYCL